MTGTAVIWYLFPETKGLTLEEIGVLFGDEITHPVGVNLDHKIDGVEVASEVIHDGLVEKEKEKDKAAEA